MDTHGERITSNAMASTAGRRRANEGIPAAIGRRAAAVAALTALVWTQGAVAQPSTHRDCASQVPEQDVQRGKGAFFSGCSTLSDSGLGGCWTQTDVDETEGCQTCYITETEFSTALFPVYFNEELEPCPTEFDYASYYDDVYGSISLVTLDDVTSSGCPEGWLYSDATGHCYLKSFNTVKAANQPEAEEICAGYGGWLIAIETEEENDFLKYDLLWIGFFGETYTGLIKETPEGEWEWPEDAIGGDDDYTCAVNFSDWIDGPDVGCDSNYAGGFQGASCMEILPYLPKTWNPFSCEVGKHYVCELEPGHAVTSPPGATPAPVVPGTTPAPVAATSSPTLSPSPLPTPSPTPIPTSAANTVAPAASAVWSGSHILSVTKDGNWDGASYSIYAQDGVTEWPVVEGATKAGSGVQIDEYMVRPGCYRFHVEAGSKPEALIWKVEGGASFGPGDRASGNGLDGGMYSVAGGVCSVGSCEASCLAAFLGTGASTASTASTVGSSSVCDAYQGLLVDGVCDLECPNERPENVTAVLQGDCVRSRCDPQAECDISDDVAVAQQNELHLSTLLLVEYSTSSVTDPSHPTTVEGIESGIAAWLGVDPDATKVVAVDGVDADEEGGASGSTRRRQLVEGIEFVTRRAQSSSSATHNVSDEAEFVRYGVRVRPSNGTESEVSSLEGVATADGAEGDLEGWLGGSVSTWSSVTVVSVGAEAEESSYIVSSSTSGTDASDDSPPEKVTKSSSSWHKSDAFAIGATLAGLLVLLAILIPCYMRGNSSLKFRPRSKGRVGAKGMSPIKPHGSAAAFFESRGEHGRPRRGTLTSHADTENLAFGSSSAASDIPLTNDRDESDDLRYLGRRGATSNGGHTRMSTADDIPSLASMSTGSKRSILSSTILSTRHNRTGTGSSYADSIVAGGAARRHQAPGPSGALHALGLGRGISHEYLEVESDGEDETLVGMEVVRNDEADRDWDETLGPRPKTAAEARANRAALEAAERSARLQGSPTPSQYSLASPAACTPRTDLAMAANLAPTPEAEAGFGGWASESESTVYQAHDQQEQLLDLPQDEDDWVGEGDRKEERGRSPGHGRERTRGASSLPEARDLAAVPRVRSRSPGARMGGIHSARHVSDAVSALMHPRLDGGGVRGGLSMQQSNFGPKRRPSHRPRRSLGNIEMGTIEAAAVEEDCGETDSDCGSRMMDSNRDNSLRGVNLLGGFHGGARDDHMVHDARGDVGDYHRGHGGADNGRLEAASNIGSPRTPGSTIFQRHFRAGVSGDLDDDLRSETAMSDMTEASRRPGFLNNSSSRSAFSISET